MTEGEAKTKWCPFARVVPIDLQRSGHVAMSGAPTYNRGSRPLPAPAVLLADSAMCVASACMAWRWDGSNVTDPKNPKGDLVWSDRSYGHCGLAGPQPFASANSLENRDR